MSNPIRRSPWLIDFKGDLEHDTHGVWEVFQFVKRHNSKMSVKANELTPGIGYRLNKENPWPISADKQSGWICINSGKPGNTAVEIMSGVLLQFNENRELVALWLKPRRT